MSEIDDTLAELNNLSPQMQATTDPQAIRQELSSPNTVYAAVQEVDTSPEVIDFSSVPITIVEEPEQHEEFSDNDWDNLLEDVGFTSHDTEEINNVPNTEETDSAILQPVFSDSSQEPIRGEEGENNEETPQVDNNSGLLPQNSPSLLMDDATSRFSGTEWYNEIRKSKIILAGIGGIGSNTAYQLARMCPEALVMYDDDCVEVGNMSGQLFSREDVGQTKVDAMCSMIQKYTSMTHPLGISSRFSILTDPGDIMICGFDNMKARSDFFSCWQSHVATLPPERQKHCLFIDGRLSIDTLQVFAIAGNDGYNQDRYMREFMFYDDEADHTVCSLKQTTYLASMIGSFIVNIFTNFIANTLNPELPYDVPFFTEYDAQNMIFKTER